jgi:magnesium transporter
MKDFFKVLWKELRVSLIVGLILGVANYLRMLGVRLLTGDTVTDSVILVVSLSVVAVVIVSKTIGCCLPILAKALKLDPALMAGPVITTLVDAISLLVYFGFANLLITI